LKKASDDIEFTLTDGEAFLLMRSNDPRDQVSIGDVDVARESTPVHLPAGQFCHGYGPQSVSGDDGGSARLATSQLMPSTVILSSRLIAHSVDR
jgi:hypothetical protein